MPKINWQHKRDADALAARIYETMQDEGLEVEVIPGTRWDFEPYGKILIGNWTPAERDNLTHTLEVNGFMVDDRGACVIVREAK